MSESAISARSLLPTQSSPEAIRAEPTLCTAELGCRIERSFDKLDEFRGEWDKAMLRLGGSVYMSYDWVRVWWQFYGEGRELRIFIFTAGDLVVGLLPLCIDCLGFGPFRFKVARLVGSNIPPKVFDPALDEHWAGAIWERLLGQLFGPEGCDLFSFGPVSSLHKGSGALPAACRAHPELVAAPEAVAAGVHTVFSLPGTMAAYFESLSKSERKKRQYELRLLRKECEVKTDVLSEPEAVQTEFERFVPQHTAQWRAEGKPGHFGAWPKAGEFNRALVEAQSRLGRVRFHRIFADGQMVSAQYCFAFGGYYFWELPSRELGPKWDRLSLGPAGAVCMLESAIQEGKTHVEAGLGHYPYKVKLGAVEHEVRTFRVSANRSGSSIRAGLFKVLRQCLLYGYHKIWYRRLMPRLPARFRKPQWELWLRFDF